MTEKKSSRQTGSFRDIWYASVIFLFLMIGSFFLGNYSAEAYFKKTIDSAELQRQFNRGKAGLTVQPIRILVMPGHEPNYGGAEYAEFKERDWNVALGQMLVDLFGDDPHFETVLARDTETWTPELSDFLEKHERSTERFIKKQKKLVTELQEEGDVVFADVVSHGNATPRVATLLYGLNRWANEESFDMVINVHFNDTAGRDLVLNSPSGAAMYVPDPQFGNGEASLDIATALSKRLYQWHSISTNPQEKEGITLNEKLIAIGAYNTLEPASILLEYGYIYEPRLEDPIIREVLMKDFALQTYLGIQDFFGNTTELDNAQTALPMIIAPESLPLRYDKDDEDKKPSLDVLALQFLMYTAGVFPHPVDTLTACPLDGVFSECTLRAVNLFQSQNELTIDGIVGKKTYEKLLQKSL